MYGPAPVTPESTDQMATAAKMAAETAQPKASLIWTPKSVRRVLLC